MDITEWQKTGKTKKIVTKHRRKIQPQPKSKLLKFSERLLSQQHVVRRQVIRKEKYQIITQPFFLKIQKFRSQINIRETHLIALSKVLGFFERPLIHNRGLDAD